MTKTYRYLSIKLSAINCIGYLIALIGPSIMDPMLKSHVRYGAREYQYSPYLAGGSIVIFFISSFYLKRSRSYTQVFRRSLVPFAGLFGPGLYVMLPEFPHMGYTMIFLSTLVLSTLTYYVYSSTISLQFLDDKSIELPAKIEYLKTSLDFWKTATITGIAAYLAFSIAWVDRVKETVAQFVTNPKELFTLGSGVTLLIVCFSVGIVIGPLTEALRNMRYLHEAFKRVRSSPNQGMQRVTGSAGDPDA